jgi:hypothetical protein
MKITNSAVLAAIPALKELVTVHLPVRASFRVARLARQVEQAAQDVDGARTRLVEQHAKRDAEGRLEAPRDESGEPIQGSVLLNDPAAFGRELNELLDLEVELAVEPIRLGDLGEKVELAPAVLIGLGPLLVDDAAAEVA